jgi:hypothetical protein
VWIYFPNFAQFKDLLPPMWLKPKKWVIMTKHPTNQIFPLAIEIFGCLQKCIDVFLHNCANAFWNLKKLDGFSSFYLGYLSLSKKFNYITKDVNILHLKSSNGGRPNYFLTSTLLEYPPLPRLTYYNCLVIEMEHFWHLVCVNVMSFKLSLLFNTFVHFPDMRCVL